MIATQRIASTTAVAKNIPDFKTINVLKWNNSRWKELCPYLLKTDGKEQCFNNGGILFENFYQGCKVYYTVYSIDVYPSRYQQGNPKYLSWSYKTDNESGDVLVDGESFNKEWYLRWRTSLWECSKPIRYPNGINNRSRTCFSLCIDKDGVDTRMDYITARKKIYVAEYIRLIKNLPEYAKLLKMLQDGENLLICEIDVPAKNKKGEYGKDCDTNNTCMMSIDKLERLMDDVQEAFGHGLCLAYALLKDLATV